MAKKSKKIGLALSGGGFRATFYHLGVIRCLRDYGRLGDVEVITSVSGGSIMAAHLVLNWAKFNGSADEFEKAAKPLFQLTGSDFRNRETRLLPWRYLFERVIGNASSGVTKTYVKNIFGKQRLSELAGTKGDPPPEVHILAADLNKPSCTVAFSSDGIRFLDVKKQKQIDEKADTVELKLVEETKFVDTTAPLVAIAVAASTAYPPLFNPINVDADLTGTRQAQLPHQHLCVTDGGVQDNSGACALRRIASENGKCDELFVSDASRSLDLDRGTNFAKSRTSTFLRVIDVLQTRIADEVYSASGSGKLTESWVRITDPVKPSICSPELHADISSIRTDLDRFSKEEIAALYHLGYTQTEQSKIIDGKRAKQDRLAPFRDTVGSSVPERLPNSRPIKTKWLGKDLATFANSMVLLAAIALTGVLGWHLWGVATNYLFQFASDDLGYAVVVDDDYLFDMTALANGDSNEDGRQFGPVVQTRTLTLRKTSSAMNTIRVRMASSVSIEASCLTHPSVTVNVSKSEPSVAGEATFKTKLDVVIDVSKHAVNEVFQVIVVGVNRGGFSGKDSEFAASRTSPGKTTIKRMRALLPANRVLTKKDSGEFHVETSFAKEALPGDPKQVVQKYLGPAPTVNEEGTTIEWEIPEGKIEPMHAYYLKFYWQPQSN